MQMPSLSGTALTTVRFFGLRVWFWRNRLNMTNTTAHSVPNWMTTRLMQDNNTHTDRVLSKFGRKAKLMNPPDISRVYDGKPCRTVRPRLDLHWSERWPHRRHTYPLYLRLTYATKDSVRWIRQWLCVCCVCRHTIHATRIADNVGWVRFTVAEAKK